MVNVVGAAYGCPFSLSQYIFGAVKIIHSMFLLIRHILVFQIVYIVKGCTVGKISVVGRVLSVQMWLRTLCHSKAEESG